MKDHPAIEILRRIWQRHFECTPDGKPPAGTVRLRPDRELPRAAEAVESPYETEARFRTKRSTNWTGYMVHLSETCDLDTVHLITHVETTPATVHEAMRAEEIHQALADEGLAPKEHLVDAAYVSAEILVNGPEQHGIGVVDPPRPKQNWQATTESAYTAEDFHVDWENQYAVCPQGKRSVYWRESQRRSGDPFVVARFRADDCNTCDARALCTRAAKHPRQLFLKPQAQYEALQAMRERITSEEGRELYKARAGAQGDDLAGRPDQRTATSPLPRSEEDAPAARRHGGGGQRRSPQRLVGRPTARSDAHLTLRAPRRVNAPTVSGP